MVRSDADQRARVAEEAATWLEKLERAITREEGLEFRKWLKPSLHREVIVERCKLWHGPEILAVLGELIPVETFSEKIERQYDRALVAIVLGVSALASVTIMTAASRVWSSEADQQNALRAEATFHTAVGERRTISLPDGSSIVLNAATQVLMRYRPYSRDLVLLRGEATFDAKHDPGRPFLVSAGARQFEVHVGEARFNVHRVTPERIELTVVQGQVTTPSSRWKEPLSPALLRAQVSFGGHTFNAGEGGILGPGWYWPMSLEVEEVNKRLAWQRGVVMQLAQPTT